MWARMNWLEVLGISNESSAPQNLKEELGTVLEDHR